MTNQNQNNAAQAAVQDLEYVVQQLRQAGRVADEEGELTDRLDVLLSRLRAPVARGEVMDALNWVDDFIARCNRDDRGSCESVNILRRALAIAPVAGEAQPVGYIHPDTLAQLAFPMTPYREVPLYRVHRPHVEFDAKRPAGLVPIYTAPPAAPQASAEYERGHADGWAAGWDQAIKQPQADKDGGQQRAGDELTRLLAENQRLRNGVDQDMAEVDRLQALYDSEWRKCKKLSADASAVRRALIAASNYIDTLGGDSNSYRAALSAPQAEQGERDA